jgi:transitional endoplasmic reticulum ATPase
MGIEADEELLRAAIAAAPDNVTARHRLAELLLGQGRWSDGLRESQLGLLRAPDHGGLLGVAAMTADLIGAGELAARYGRLLGTVVAPEVANDGFEPTGWDGDGPTGGPAGGQGIQAGSMSGLVKWGRRSTDQVGDGGGVNPAQAATMERLMARRTEAAPRRGHRRAEVPMLASPRYTLRDVAGMTDLKWRLGNMLTENRSRLLGGLLLVGPAGTGMSFLAEAAVGQHLAGREGSAMVTISIPELVMMSAAEAERTLLSAFDLAASARPAALILEGIDALCDEGRMHGKRLEMLMIRMTAALDEAMSVHDLVVVGTSTAPWRIDRSLLRAGRFARMLFVPPPDLLARSRILADRLSYLPISTDVSAADIATVTEGFSATELQMICARAAEHAMSVSRHVGSMWSITQRDLTRAVEGTTPSSVSWFVQAHSSLRDTSTDLDPLFDYVRRNVRRLD